MYTIIRAALICAITVLLASCSPLTLNNVDFGWPVESVVTVGNDNMIQERRYGLALNVAGLATEEFADSNALKRASLRVLRSQEGYYYITGRQFKHVYVLKPGAAELVAKSKIKVGEHGLHNPALNLRPPHVVLLDENGVRVYLDSDDVVKNPRGELAKGENNE